MSISRIKQIKRILKDHDARDPRGALLAIEQVVAQKNTNPRKPVAVIKVFDQPEGKGQLKSQVEIKYSERHLEPRHLGNRSGLFLRVRLEVRGIIQEPEDQVRLLFGSALPQVGE